MPIILYKKTKQYDDCVDLEKKVAFEIKRLVETSKRSELDKVNKEVEKIRKNMGLDPKTGESTKKVKPCFPPPSTADKLPLGYIKTTINGVKINSFLEKLNTSLEEIFDVDEDSVYQFISWQSVKIKFNKIHKKIKDFCDCTGKYELLAYKYLFRIGDKILDKEKYCNDIISRGDNSYGPVFDEGLEIHGVFKDIDNKLLIAVKNNSVEGIKKTFQKIKEMINYVMSQKFPYDYVLKWR